MDTDRGLPRADRAADEPQAGDGWGKQGRRKRMTLSFLGTSEGSWIEGLPAR